MNLKEYFQQQQNIHMSDTDKLDLYQNFMVKNMKSHYSRKRSFLHVKSFVYSLVIMFLLFGFYGIYFVSDRYSGEEGVSMNGENAAQADYIAKVVDFNGSFYISHNGKQVQTSTIQDGDVVTLQEETQLVFNINTNTKAKLIGPAQFSITKAADTTQYELNVLYGDFIQLNQEQTNDKIIVKNNGGPLLVSTVGKDKKETRTNLNAKQILAIQKNDITLFDNIDTFTQAVKNNDISQTFTLTTTQESTTQESEQTGGSELSTFDLTTGGLSTFDGIDEEINQEVSSQLGGVLLESQKVITPEQNEAIRSSLNKDFLTRDTKELYISIAKGDDKAVESAYTSIEKKVEQLYTTFDLKYQQQDGKLDNKLLGLKKTILTFIASVHTNYMIPPKYFDSLDTLNNRLDYLSKVSFGSEIEDTLPNNLLF